MSDVEQAHRQAKVVVHLANALARVYSDRVKMYELAPHLMADLADLDGCWSASIMEYLGNILSDMDSTDDGDDAWTHPIFEAAQERWPASSLTTVLKG